MTPLSIVKKLARMGYLLTQVPEDIIYVGPWVHSLLPGHYPLKDERPWISFGAINWLKGYLKPDMKVFEYGSGGSTIFLARRVQEVFSVEHEQGYFDVVQSELNRKNLTNCTYRLALPEKLPENSDIKYVPGSFTSYQPRWQGLDFTKYVTMIDQFPDNYFDLVVVDGRSRSSCILRALKKVKRNGWILLDNSEREGYGSGKELLKKYDRHDFYGLVPSNVDLYQTSVWCLNDEPEFRGLS